MRFVHAALLSFDKRLSNLRKNYNAYGSTFNITVQNVYITVDRISYNIRLASPSAQACKHRPREG
jgi:hypothetical protein